MSLESGQILQSRYRVIRPLSKSGTGGVYYALDMRLNIHVALKEMLSQPDIELRILNDFRRQFEQEAVVLARLNHLHLVRVVDFFEQGENAYLVMDYVEGENLSDMVQRRGPLPEDQVLAWSTQILDALAYCHSHGVIHRDIKPENIIIRPDGQAILVGFGLVKLWNLDDRSTKTVMRGMGTPEYSPPEQYELASRSTDPRSDLYSLGATMYFALTGQSPPTATLRIADPDTLLRFKTRISSRTASVMEKAMELARPRRWSSASEMATALGGKIQGWHTTTPEPQIAASPISKRASSIPRGVKGQSYKLSRFIAISMILFAILLIILLNYEPLMMPRLRNTPTVTLTDTPKITPTTTFTFTPTPQITPTTTFTFTVTPRITPTLTVTPVPTPISPLPLVQVTISIIPISLLVFTMLFLGSVWGLSRYSGLSFSVLLRQRWHLIEVGREYPNYYRNWENSRLLVQLISLLDFEFLDVQIVTSALESLSVPIDKNLVEIALEQAANNDLLKLDNRKYRWKKLLLAKALRAQLGESKYVELADRIRQDHPLFVNARRFLERVGFEVESLTGTPVYRCKSPSSFKVLLGDVVYAWVMPGVPPNGSHILDIHKKLQDLTPLANNVLLITEHRLTDQAWAQIGTLSMEGLIILPIEGGVVYEGLVEARERQIFHQEVEKRLGPQYDPYDTRDPVSQTFSFFGRDALVEDIMRRMQEGRPVGVFGLRKLGKSSLLQALRVRALFPVALLNLQSLGPQEDPYREYVRALEYWKNWMKIYYGLQVDLPDITTKDSTASFVKAIYSLLNHLEQHHSSRMDQTDSRRYEARLGLLLDEIELITPRQNNDTGPNLERYLTLMRAIRGLVDEDGRLSLVVASLNPSINRINAWQDEQNPAFNLFQEIYLPPLAHEDCVQMIRNIGRQVGLVYNDSAVESIANLSGGHPFLARQFCSLLYKKRDRQPGEITADAIHAVIEHFIYDAQTVTHLDAGIWQDAGNVALWGEAQAKVNQAILLELARAEEPMTTEELLATANADARRTALINLERFHFIYQSEPDHYALRYGLLRIWLRRRKLGLKE